VRPTTTTTTTTTTSTTTTTTTTINTTHTTYFSYHQYLIAWIRLKEMLGTVKPDVARQRLSIMKSTANMLMESFSSLRTR
jgi:pyruvate/oxaloacetate carboxyltransferase